MEAIPFIELKGINKSFPGVKALTDVNVAFYPGRVHVLMGENGAGKSTIIKTIAGIYQPDSGQILRNGIACRFLSPRQALQAGISVIHQELSVVPDLSVAENIFLGREPVTSTGLIDRTTMFRQAEELLASIGVHVNVRDHIRKLSNGDKQMVEIARAISQNSSMVIMDEPTSLLSDHEVDTLFAVIENLKKNDVAVIYISHRMKEISAIGDDITILRDGNVIKTLPVATTSAEEIITLMVGRQITQYYYKAAPPQTHEPALSVINLTRKGVFENVSFDLFKGEILGVAGLVGSGRTEVMRAVFGADKYDSGSIAVFGQQCHFRTPREAIEAGIGLIPEERRNQGLLLAKDLKINTSLASLFQHSAKGFLNFAWEKEITLDYIKKLKTKTPSENALAQNLSGGNQQKVVIAKWLAANVKILIMDEPTRGIDVNAKAEIYALMKEYLESGGSIIMVSSELPEILGVSHRVLVMSDGKVAATLNAEDATEEIILRHASSAMI